MTTIQYICPTGAQSYLYNVYNIYTFIWKFSSHHQISSFFNKIFRNNMCQVWSKQIEKEGRVSWYWMVSGGGGALFVHCWILLSLIVQILVMIELFHFLRIQFLRNILTCTVYWSIHLHINIVRYCRILVVLLSLNNLSVLML